MAFGCHDLHHLSSVCLPIVLSLRSSVPRWFDFQPLEKRHKSQFYAHFLMLIGQCDRAAASYAGLWFGATLNISIRSYCRIGNDLMWVRPFSTWLETQIHFSASTDALPLIWRWDPFVAAILTHAIHSAKHLIQPSDNWLKSKWLWFFGLWPTLSLRQTLACGCHALKVTIFISIPVVSCCCRTPVDSFCFQFQTFLGCSHTWKNSSSIEFSLFKLLNYICL